MTKLNLILWAVSLMLQCLLLTALFSRAIARRIPILAVLIGFYILRSVASYTVFRYSAACVVGISVQLARGCRCCSADCYGMGAALCGGTICGLGYEGARRFRSVNSAPTRRVLRVSDRCSGSCRGWFDVYPRQPAGTCRPHHFVYLDGLPSGLRRDGSGKGANVDSPSGCGLRVLRRRQYYLPDWPRSCGGASERYGVSALVLCGACRVSRAGSVLDCCSAQDESY